MEKNVVNKNIRQIMRDKKLTEHKLAESAGISDAVLSNIIRCKRKVYADEVASIAAALQTPVSKLFQLQGDTTCHNCKFWNQFYVKRHDGKIIPWFYGYCFRPGCCGPREEWLSCEKHQQRK